MKVKDLIVELLGYNMDADISVVVKDVPYWFDISYGVAEGCTKHSCTTVSLNVASSKEQSSSPAPLVEAVLTRQDIFTENNLTATQIESYRELIEIAKQALTGEGNTNKT